MKSYLDNERIFTDRKNNYQLLGNNNPVSLNLQELQRREDEDAFRRLKEKMEINDIEQKYYQLNQEVQERRKQENNFYD